MFFVINYGLKPVAWIVRGCVINYGLKSVAWFVFGCATNYRLKPVAWIVFVAYRLSRPADLPTSRFADKFGLAGASPSRFVHRLKSVAAKRSLLKQADLKVASCGLLVREKLSHNAQLSTRNSQPN